jgi:pimeloyl-ACP methyl ester carboxylesterase
MLGESVEEHMSLGLMLSIVCAEDLPSVTEEDVAAEQRTRFGPLVEELRGACAVWPVAPRPSSPHPGAIFAPALVLSGALDPATPPRWGTIAMKHLSKGKHVIVPQAGHGVTSRGCVPKLIQQFIESANASSIDESCVERHRRPPFFIDLQGPRE